MSEQTQQQEGLKEPTQLLTLQQHMEYIETMCREIKTMCREILAILKPAQTTK